jgi:GNAT superfamily N-acetyltransferase
LPAEPAVIDGDGVRLLPVAPDAVDEVIQGGPDGHPAGRGWPHRDTGPALAFTAMGGLTWLVVDRDGLVVGEAGTKSPPDDTGTVEIGYGLAGPSRGHGLGTRAVATLLSWLDRQPDIHRVIARVDPANEPSWRLLERLGFLPEQDAPGRPASGERTYERLTPVDSPRGEMRW